MRLTRTLGAFLVALAAPALAQVEGHLEMKITSSQGMGGSAHTWFSKGSGRTQIEFQSPMGPMKMTSLVKASEPKVVYLIDDAKRTYSILDTSTVPKGTGETSRETYTVKPLGNDTVAGYSCQKALLTSSRGTEMEICSSKDIPAWREMRVQMAKAERQGDMWKSLEDARVDGFPVRMRTGKDGMQMTWELVKYEKTSVPASMLEIPPGYQKAEGLGAMAGALPPEAQKQLEGAMKNLTPEQRKQIEELMKQQQKKGN